MTAKLEKVVLKSVSKLITQNLLRSQANLSIIGFLSDWNKNAQVSLSKFQTFWSRDALVTSMSGIYNSIAIISYFSKL